SDSKTYDGTTTSTATPTVSGLQTGDTVTGKTQAFASKNALGTNGSTLTVTAYTVNDGNSGGNYTVTTHTALGTISKAALDITAASDSKTYDGTTTSSATPSVSGLQTGDSVTGKTQAFASKNVLGTNGSMLAVTAYTVNDGNSGGNYTVDSSGTATGTISKRALTISAATDSKTYDGTTTSTLTPTFGSLQTGDTTTTFSQAFDSRNAGSRTLTPSGGVNDGNSGNNYSYTFNTASGTISQPA